MYQSNEESGASHGQVGNCLKLLRSLIHDYNTQLENGDKLLAKHGEMVATQEAIKLEIEGINMATRIIPKEEAKGIKGTLTSFLGLGQDAKKRKMLEKEKEQLSKQAKSYQDVINSQRELSIIEGRLTFIDNELVKMGEQLEQYENDKVAFTGEISTQILKMSTIAGEINWESAWRSRKVALELNVHHLEDQLKEE